MEWLLAYGDNLFGPAWFFLLVTIAVLIVAIEAAMDDKIELGELQSVLLWCGGFSFLFILIICLPSAHNIVTVKSTLSTNVQTLGEERNEEVPTYSPAGLYEPNSL